jgi:uncharacterized DUF497 family protein
MDLYEWDDRKNDLNRLKHGVGFEIVFEFGWEDAVLETDDRYEYGEERIRAFGRCDGRPFCVAYTPRGSRLRIISVRPMHEKEARRYDI